MKTYINKKTILSKFYFKLIGISFVFISNSLVIAQNVKAEIVKVPIMILGKAYEDSVVLRWSPSSASTWEAANNKGFTLTKIIYRDNGDIDTLLLTKNYSIKPLSLDEMKAKATKNDKYTPIMAQAIYGKNFRMGNTEPKSDFEAMQQGADAFQMRYMMALLAADMSPQAAMYAGLRYVDKDVKVGEKYSYIVQCDTTVLNSQIVGGLTFVINKKPLDEVDPENLIAINGDKKIELRWTREQENNFTLFDIERSDDNGKTWKKINKEPYATPYNPNLENSQNDEIKSMMEVARLNHIYYDSIPENYKDYFYRIKGLDPFGDMSVPSASVIAHGIDLTPPLVPVFLSADNIKENLIELKWKTVNQEPDLKGFYIERAMDEKGPFVMLTQSILPKSVNSFIDSTATALAPNYYIIVVEDTAGNRSFSTIKRGFLKDSIPPMPPLEISGVMDTLGHVYLAWKQNSEPDLNGYKVYSSYKKDGDYIQVTKEALKQNGFIDSISLNSLDRQIYYRVVAVDKNGNHSDYSEPAMVRKTVLVPPSTPTAKKIYQKDDNIIIEFNGSSSEAVAGYFVYRSDENAEYQLAGFVPTKGIGEDFSYIDTNTVYKHTYSYVALTIDSTDLHSELSSPVKIVGNSTKRYVLASITDLKIGKNKNNYALFSWDYKAENKCFYMVYRSENGQDFILWESVSGEDKSYIDSRVKKGNKYEYYFVVKNPNTNELSKPSNKVSMQF